MTKFALRLSMFLAILTLIVAGTCAPAFAQAKAAKRKLAPGIVTIVPPQPEENETFHGPLPLVEVPSNITDLDYSPNFAPKSTTVFERAKAVTLRHGIWNLEFSFKPMRMVYVDVPQANGKMQRKLIWYMVYRVKNNGGHYQVKEVKSLVAETIEHITYKKEPVTELTEPKLDADGNPVMEGATPVMQPVKIRFFPHFVLQSNEFKKQYLDRVIPAAMGPIKAREFPGQKDVKLYDSLAISTVDIPLSEDRIDRGVWGVVTWEEIDPKLDYFSVYIQGLTNAFKFEDPAGAYKKGEKPGTGRTFTLKTLQLNFWRPGDTVAEHEDEIRYGVRLDADQDLQTKIFAEYGIEKPIDHLWLYR